MFEESDCDSDNIPLIPSSRARKVRVPRRNDNLNPRRRLRRNIDLMKKKETNETDELQTERSLGDQIVSSNENESCIPINKQVIGYSNTICSGTFELAQDFDKNSKDSRIFWTLFNSKKPIIYARTLGFGLKRVALSAFPIDSINPKVNSIIEIDKDGSNFKSSHFTAMYWNTDGNKITPRRSHIHTIDGEFHHKLPSKKATGQLILNFEGKKVIPSCRNAIILDIRDNKTMYIRKVKPNLFEIDVLIPLHLETIIEIGVSSCIYDK